MSEPYFDITKLKIGDRLWDFEYGWGNVTEINKHHEYQIGVNFKYGHRLTYTISGKNIKEMNQTLFYDEIKFDPPPRPKRMVKVREVIERVYFGEYGVVYSRLFDNWKKFANNKPMTMTLEWDEEID